MTMRAAVASFLTSCALCEPKLYIEKTKLTNDNQPRLPAVSARGTCLRACLPLAQPRDDVKTAPKPTPPCCQCNGDVPPGMSSLGSAARGCENGHPPTLFLSSCSHCSFRRHRTYGNQVNELNIIQFLFISYSSISVVSLSSSSSSSNSSSLSLDSDALSAISST